MNLRGFDASKAAREPAGAPAVRRRDCLGLAGAWALGLPAGASPQVRAVGPGRPFRRLADALAAAKAGDVIELDPGVYPGDVGVAAQPGLTIRGLGAGAVLQADGRHAEGKAILVVRGGVVVENVEFRGARVPAGNGAGIRFERGHLRLLHCRFFDNEMGVLTAGDPAMTLDVEACTFGAAPRHEGMLHHLLYAGTIGRLRVQSSRFGGGWRGHLVKSRAAVSEIRDCRLDDGPDGEASYELEFPNGGDLTVEGNLIVQGARTQNRTMLSVGAEAQPGMAARLRLVGNTLVNHAGPEAQFVRVWAERLGGAPIVRMAGNRFVGPGQLALPDDWDAGGNQRDALSDWTPPR